MRVKHGTRFASRNDCRFYDFPKGDGFKTVLRNAFTVIIRYIFQGRCKQKHTKKKLIN